MDIHENYMDRCLQLAALGAGQVAPNPLVGAVLVYNDRIIGEGFHQQFGKAHAEVNCFESVAADDEKLLPDATLYVSLEPCAHVGKTPPCADLIIEKGVKKVVVGCIDPFGAVAGRGVEKLKNAGLSVTVGVLEKECQWVNRRFFTFHQKQRPYIILKWAQTADGKIGAGKERMKITNALSDRIVHQWRSEEAAILVGTNTALIDDPALTTRLVPGHDPVRLVIDKQLRLPQNLQLFDGSVATIVFNENEEKQEHNLFHYLIQKDQPVLPQILQALHNLSLQSVLVEGGARLLQSFINAGLWDEARVIEATGVSFPQGIAAPVLPTSFYASEAVDTDHIYYYQN